MCTTHACMTWRPGGLVEGPQALASQEGPGAGMVRHWDSLVPWSPGIAIWISCGMSRHTVWAVSCKPNSTMVGCNSLLCRWHLVWGSGEEPHHHSVPPRWSVLPEGNSQIPGLLVLLGVCKFKWRPFETLLHKAHLKASRQHTDLTWKSEERVQKEKDTWKWAKD